MRRSLRDRPDSEKTCCTADSAMDAKRVCDQIGIPHFTLDMQEDFEERVIQPFYEAYLAGETPNPCVNCNSFVKWDALWKRAKAVGADYIATGHYAMTEAGDGRTYILRGGDAGQGPELFPLGHPPGNPGQDPVPPGPPDQTRSAQARRRGRPAHRAQSAKARTSASSRTATTATSSATRAKEQGAAIPEGRMRGPDGKDLGAASGPALLHHRPAQGPGRRPLGAAGGAPVREEAGPSHQYPAAGPKKEELYSAGFRADRANFFEPFVGERECLGPVPLPFAR